MQPSGSSSSVHAAMSPLRWTMSPPGHIVTDGANLDSSYERTGVTLAIRAERARLGVIP